ncbi:MAG: hypothetical protein ACYTEQ_19825, partial [Planctomycetota bacterium]|jgi:hypothetical protein
VTKQSSCPAPSVLGDAGGGVTGNESFVTVNDDTATLPNSRQITAGTNIGIVDGGAGGAVTINNSLTKNEHDNCIGAAHFVPAQSPFLPAPIENYYIAASGFAGKVIRFDTGAKSAASCFWSNRWVNHPVSGSYLVNVQINFFTDNASLNNIAFDLYQKSGATPSLDLSTAPASIGAQVKAGVGAYKQNRAVFQFTTLGDNYQFVLERQTTGDTNPGTMYVQSILPYFSAALS